MHFPGIRNSYTLKRGVLEGKKVLTLGRQRVLMDERARFDSAHGLESFVRLSWTGL